MVLRMWRTVCALNTENTLNVELKFELFDFCISILFFLSANNTVFGWPCDERIIITTDVAYGCGTWPSVVTAVQRLKV